MRFLCQVQRGFAALQSEAPDLIDNLGIPYDPKELKPELKDGEEEEEEEKEDVENKEGEDKEAEDGSPNKEGKKKKKRDPKEEMPLFLNQVTNLIAAAVPGKRALLWRNSIPFLVLATFASLVKAFMNQW